MKLLILLLLIPGYSKLQKPNCTCRNTPPFMYVEERSSLVAEVDVVKYGGFSYRLGLISSSPKFIDVKIRRVLRGNETEGEIIRIYGDDFDSCNQSIRPFVFHKKWIIAAHKVGEKMNKKGQVLYNEYAISLCGTYNLKVTRNKVVGRIIAEEVRTTQILDAPFYQYKNVIEEMNKNDFYKLYKILGE